MDDHKYFGKRKRKLDIGLSATPLTAKIAGMRFLKRRASHFISK
jgi:hypothetical protein